MKNWQQVAITINCNSFFIFFSFFGLARRLAPIFQCFYTADATDSLFEKYLLQFFTYFLFWPILIGVRVWIFVWKVNINERTMSEPKSRSCLMEIWNETNFQVEKQKRKLFGPTTARCHSIYQLNRMLQLVQLSNESDTRIVQIARHAKYRARPFITKQAIRYCC